MFNKKFKELTSESKSNIDDFCRIHGEIIPTDYKEFLMSLGGRQIVQEDGELCVTLDGKNDKFIFTIFYNLEDIKGEIRHLNFKGDKYKFIPLTDFLWIGEGEMQNYLAIGNNEENCNQIFWYDDQEQEVNKVSESLEEFINQNLMFFKF